MTAAILATAVYPDFGAVDGAARLEQIIGALLTLVLFIAVLMLVVCAVAWAVAGAHGSVRAASQARAGVFVALGAAVLAGAGVAWVNFLLHLGSSI